MEAQSQALPCVSTTLSGIPELIEHGRTGLLVPPGDRTALAEAIGRLLGDPELRRRLGRAGAERVRRDFDSRRTIGVIENLLRGSLAT
jgi:glycosyltransferase involved in cell wall biosynthesis